MVAGCSGLSVFRHQTLCVAVDVNGARVLARRCVPMAQAWQVLVEAVHAGEVLVEQQLRDLRRALQRLVAAVMWRDGVQLEPLGNTVFYECEDTTSAAATAVAKCEARPPGIAQHNASTESELAACSGEAGSTRPGAVDTTSADVTAAAKSADEARPPGIAKHSTRTDSELAAFYGEAGPSWFAVNGTTSADATAVAVLAGEARPTWIEEHSATTKSELTEASDEESSNEARLS